MMPFGDDYRMGVDTGYILDALVVKVSGAHALGVPKTRKNEMAFLSAHTKAKSANMHYCAKRNVHVKTEPTGNPCKHKR